MCRINKKVFSEIQARSVGQLPIAIASPSVIAIISGLVDLLIAGKNKDCFREDLTCLQFFEDLIDGCVMECYYRDHMAERDLLFLDELAPHIAYYNPDAPELKQREFMLELHRKLNDPSSKIRNRLLRISAESPDLLAVVKKEGKV